MVVGCPKNGGGDVALVVAGWSWWRIVGDSILVEMKLGKDGWSFGGGRAEASVVSRWSTWKG